ncbi:hypothetical protein REPUB_Repub02eG0236400 [Reevesia pubescens]
MLNELFEFIKPWHHSFVQREISYWVILDEVPFQAWHKSFFKSLGDKWCSFIKFDSNTTNKTKFDLTRFLVTVDSKMFIPSSVLVNLRGNSYKILVSIEEYQSNEDFRLVPVIGNINNLDIVRECLNDVSVSTTEGACGGAVNHINDSICFISSSQRSFLEKTNLC